MLFNENYPAHAISKEGKIRLMVSYYPNLDPDQAVESLESNGLLVTGRDDFGKFAYVVAPIAEINRIAALPFVVYMSPFPRNRNLKITPDEHCTKPT